MRTLETVIDSINKQTHERKETRYIHNLAEALSCIARIPEGRQLACILGTGYERSNKEALTTWIKKELKHCSLDKPSHLDYLYARLLQTFGDHNLV